MEYLQNVSYPPSVGRFNDQQIAQRSTWAGVPDEKTVSARMHTIHVVPQGSSTLTVVNPIDPTGDNRWLGVPTSDAPVIPAGRM